MTVSTSTVSTSIVFSILQVAETTVMLAVSQKYHCHIVRGVLPVLMSFQLCVVSDDAHTTMCFLNAKNVAICFSKSSDSI